MLVLLFGAALPHETSAAGPSARGERRVAARAYTLQVANNRDEAASRATAESLGAAGCKVRVLRADLPDQGVWYQVHVGSFRSAAAARAAGARLQRRRYIRDFVVASLDEGRGAGLLRGQVVDQRGAAIVGATVVLVGGDGVEKSATTNARGVYAFGGLAPGKYTVRASANGFAPYERTEVGVAAGGGERLDVTLGAALERQDLTVAPTFPSTNPEDNLTGLVLRGKALDALPNGPGGLAAALRALTVRSATLSGPQIIVDGFTGGRLPPKESIREIRINENPFSAEFDQLGFGRVEILTKPGTDTFRAGAYFSFNDESLNSRNPFAPDRAPFQSRLYSGNVSGPLLGKRASFFVDFERSRTDNNALINAIILDQALNATPFSLAVATPQERTTFSPRLDFQLNSANTLVSRYTYTRSRLENAGIGDFSLASRAYGASSEEQTLQLTETAVLGQRAINEVRFQYVRTRSSEEARSFEPTVVVPSAFTGGGPDVGLSFHDTDRWELHDYVTWTLGNHALRAGGRLRGIRLRDVSPFNFNGTFTFAGGLAPQLDADNRIVRGEDGGPVIVPITSVERYRRTLLFQDQGLTAAEIRARGGGATQFSIAGGNPEAGVTQYDAGVFVQDDWRLRSNLTLNMGLRYEAQTNLGDWTNLAPRVGFAWAPDGQTDQPKTVVRGGFGVFYDRIGEQLVLRAGRFGGAGQQQFIVSDPAILDLFPSAPSVEALTAFLVPQALVRLADDIRAPYTTQFSISVERQLPLNFTAAATFVNIRALHLLRSRNINAPLTETGGVDLPGGARPYGDVGDIFQYESSGRLNQNQLIANVVHRYGERMSSWATYILGEARSDTDGADTFAANPYDLSGEYGRSAMDVRHNFYLGGWFRGPWDIELSPLVFVRSGLPFNITTGRDENGDTLYTERPAFATDLARPSVVVTSLGAFDLSPLPGQQIVPRNFGVGPRFVTVNVRLSRTFSFGGEPGATAGADSSQGSGWLSRRPLRQTFSVQVENLFNHTNFGLPVGNLSSPFFGRSYSSAGDFGFGSNPAGNRRIEVQIAVDF